MSAKEFDNYQPPEGIEPDTDDRGRPLRPYMYLLWAIYEKAKNSLPAVPHKHTIVAGQGSSPAGYCWDAAEDAIDVIEANPQLVLDALMDAGMVEQVGWQCDNDKYSKGGFLGTMGIGDDCPGGPHRPVYAVKANK